MPLFASDYGYSSDAVSMRCIACGSMDLNCCDGTMPQNGTRQISPLREPSVSALSPRVGGRKVRSGMNHAGPGESPGAR